MQLKKYQQQSLDLLRDYLESVSLYGVGDAYKRICNHNPRPNFRSRRVIFQPLEGLENVPYICLRLPTGGGKTLLCAHSVDLARQALWGGTFPLALWLVPTEAIRTQTLETLQNPHHANNRTLAAAFGSRFRIFDISDFANIRPQDIENNACIIVSTFAALRVNNTQGRRVYGHHEDLEGHFSRLPIDVSNLERREEDGQVKFSFVNLLALRRPLVLVDEAHNAKSALSVEVLRRVNPRAVIEYTATPANNSNIIESVSAQELKDEEMIKLPIHLHEHGDWQQAISASVQTRARLEQLAHKEADYIRPLVLFQAQNKKGEVTVDILKKYLCEQENIAPEQIAIATGDQRELDGLNLFDPYCPLRYIITVKALKEGWDCSFAYVLCSVTNSHSSTEVEQLLGRVLRMPYAKRQSQQELNQAYAHVSSSSWPQSAALMEDHLVKMGFEQTEVGRFLDLQLDLPELQEQDNGPLFTRGTTSVFSVRLESEPDLSKLDLAEKEHVSVHQQARGFLLQVNGVADASLLKKIVATIPDKKERRNTQLHAEKWLSRWAGNAKPADRGELFIVPQLCFVLDGTVVPLAAENCLGIEGWNPLDYYNPIGEDEFRADEKGHIYLLDVEEEKLRVHHMERDQQLSLDGVMTNMDETELVLAMEKRLFLKLHGEYMAQGALHLYLQKAVHDLLQRKDMNLPLLLRTRAFLEKLLESRLLAARTKAYTKSFQLQLFADDGYLRSGLEHHTFTFPAQYPVSSKCEGRRLFNKHYYRDIGAMNGEESDCAVKIDQHKKVKYWIRNLERQERYSFWLPTATDKFYPDFIAQLHDGRILLVEYKGAHLDNEDTREKNSIGRAWAKASGNLFLTMWKYDEQGRDMAAQLQQILG